MIVIYHDNYLVVEILENNNKINYQTDFIVNVIFEIALKFPEQKIVWCNVNIKKYLNIDAIENLMHHNKLMLSYNVSDESYLGKRIGYIEYSPIVKINKEVTYPTWQMSSDVGVLHASVISILCNEIDEKKDFDYFLNSIGHIGSALGLFCYSEPKLLKNKDLDFRSQNSDIYTLFKFVKQHYRARWVFLIFLNLFLYERILPLLPMLYTFFYKRRLFRNDLLNNVRVNSNKNLINEESLDVIIPTIGRKEYLYDVLCDFRKQTLLPKNIIIVEQNPQLDSQSELDYIYNENWPFNINLIFTNKTGACNARNVAISNTSSEWVFLADDDNRFDSNLIENFFSTIKKYGCEVITTSYLQKNESKIFTEVIQWSTFGAGNSVIKREILKNVSFNLLLEFGYGEDADFGYQLRNIGYDVIYTPKIEILHLKAPIGGFRTKPKPIWSNDPLVSKPCPTVMLSKILNQTTEQILGYKTNCFFNFYKSKKTKNPYNYYKQFKSEWDRSIYWANELLNKKQVVN